MLRLAVWKLKEEDLCHIEKMEPERDPTVYVHAKDMGEWNGDRESITRDMNELCNGLPIRLVSNVKISKEGFDNLTDGKNRMMAPAHCCCGVNARRRRSGNTKPVQGQIIHRIVASD